MSDERTDLILNVLRAIRAEQAAQREKLDEIISRIGALDRSFYFDETHAIDTAEKISAERGV